MKNEMLPNEELRKYVFYGVGGPADEFWKIYDIEEFSTLWAETIAKKIPKLVLGIGANLLLSDKGFRGRVFLLKTTETIWEENKAKIQAGQNWQCIVEDSNKRGWADLCNMSGIPGLLGGMIRGNAGAYGSETGEFITEVEFINEKGQLQKFSNQECEFGYRTSIFKSNPDWCIVRATLEFSKKEDPDESLKASRELIQKRWQNHPPGKSCGSFFKNPVPGKVFSRRLLEDAGATGDQIGEAQISPKHVNFFMNLGNATQEDILKLSRKWQKVVLEKNQIKLEPEVQILDEFGNRVEL
ncbi:UDP-N-acetylmuramate dehydrogenase [Candidatus Gracilibacteria bacterium]|nr:UDP-N-acetylmuramate dehydrogenase [Candidatus Gracilibacteria bacterium]